IESDPEVERLIHQRTEHVGPDEILLAAKVAFVRTLSVAELAAAIDRVELAVRSAVPATRLIYIEPDIERAGGAPAVADGGSAGTPASDGAGQAPDTHG
ncbi:MAG: hypothetical protein ACKOYM_04545, partial [Actinomycetes bacterium]